MPRAPLLSGSLFLGFLLLTGAARADQAPAKTQAPTKAQAPAKAEQQKEVAPPTQQTNPNSRPKEGHGNLPEPKADRDDRAKPQPAQSPFPPVRPGTRCKQQSDCGDLECRGKPGAQRCSRPLQPKPDVIRVT